MVHGGEAAGALQEAHGGDRAGRVAGHVQGDRPVTGRVVGEQQQARIVVALDGLDPVGPELVAGLQRVRLQRLPSLSP